MRSERISAWTAAAHRNGSVNSAEIAVIRQYVAENQVEPSWGLVDSPSTLLVSFSANFAPTNAHSPAAASPAWPRRPTPLAATAATAAAEQLAGELADRPG